MQHAMMDAPRTASPRARQREDGECEEGECEADDWLSRARALGPRLRALHSDEPSAPHDASAFPSWTQLHVSAPGGRHDGESGRRALDALRRDRRFDAPDAYARQCRALGGVDAAACHVLRDYGARPGEFYEEVREAQNALWAAARCARGASNERAGRHRDAIRCYADAVALDDRSADAFRGRARAAVETLDEPDALLDDAAALKRARLAVDDLARAAALGGEDRGDADLRRRATETRDRCARSRPGVVVSASNDARARQAARRPGDRAPAAAPSSSDRLVRALVSAVDDDDAKRRKKHKKEKKEKKKARAS